jgi:hypothetical protein
VAIDHEAQGSNTSIGMQMFWDFQKSLELLPANAGDIFNSLLSKSALDIIKTNGIATQNTLYHIDGLTDQGGSWSVKPHPDFNAYYSSLLNVTLPSVPANLKGYPTFPYRIAVSQGNANGALQTISTDTDILYNQSPSFWCVSPSGTAFGVGNWILKTTPFRQATARVVSSWNNDAFNCKVGTTIKTLFTSWHINFGHWKYYGSNPLNDWWMGGPARNYDEVAASSLPANLLFINGMAASSDYPLAAISTCNLKQFPEKQVGFSPTVSGLDLHSPGNVNLPRFPNLSLVPGNVGGGLNLMQQNNYNLTTPGLQNNSNDNNFGFPHLTAPTDPYQYTPFDAIWANTTNNSNYDDNTMHVEDPNPLIGEFLSEELAPYDLYLSNRLLQDQVIYCGEDGQRQKYYADFEARNSILAGNQSIYQNNLNSNNWYPRKRTSQGDFTVGEGAVVTFHANNDDGYGKITLGAGFSSKHGSIFRAYIYRDESLCAPFSYDALRRLPPIAPAVPEKEPRPIFTKRATAIKKTQEAQTKTLLALYPNPTQGELIYVLNQETVYDYSISNSLGTVVQMGIVSNLVNKINLANLARGVYFITIKNKNYSQTDRIILQ